MKYPTLKTQPVSIAALFTVIVLITSCKRDNVTKQFPVYPKEVAIEYRITSLDPKLTRGDVGYYDKSGTLRIADNSILPFSMKFKRIINKPEVISAGITSKSGGTVKIELLVNNKVVSTHIPSSYFSIKEMITSVIE